jgi:predicted AAA+ superfamily ATPase
VLHGPRSVGKSTLLRDLADELPTPVTDLDELAMRDAVAADPALFASATAPVLIDEFQHVPALLDAVKAELNRI